MPPVRPRRRLTASVLALVTAFTVVPVALIIAPSAYAASGPFVIDGNVPDAGATELPDLYGNVKELGPINSNTTKIGVINNAAVPMLGLTNPNAQVDLRRAWLTTKKDTSTNHDWLYFAWERDSNSGSGFIAYEFMQDPPPAACAYDTASDATLTANCNPWKNRRAGDFMILWDQQGGSRALVLRTWSGTAPNLTLSAGVELTAAVSEAQFSADGFRGEAAVDLTATIFGGSTACKSFANTIPSTVTGNSDTADYKDTILKTAPPITNCTSTTVTTPQLSDGSPIPSGFDIGTGVRAVRDEAVVSLTGGTATPAGSVAFFLCKVTGSNLCGSGGTSIGSTNLSGTAYPATVDSPTAYVTSAGRYCWRATFSGDSANGIPPSSDSRVNECFDVAPVTPGLSTNASADVLLGNSVSDSATLGGTATQPTTNVIETASTSGAAAGGTITFTLYGPNNCTTVAYTSSTVAVSGDGTYSSPSFTPASPGTYHWAASYSGNLPNTKDVSHNTGCTDSDEDVVVSTVPSTIATTQSWVPSDSATVSSSAGGNLAGKVTFTLYQGATCTGTVLYGPVDVTVSGSSPRTVSTTSTTAVTATGSVSWKVQYTSTNSAQRGIPESCQESTALTITNGSSVSSP
jgi:hypothetical protein